MSAASASPYGSLYRRAAAAGIDAAIINVVLTAAVFAVDAAAHQFGWETWQVPADWGVQEALLAGTLGMAVAGTLYRAIYEASPWQATPGRRALSLKVCTTDGERLSPAAALTRALVRAPGMLLFGLGALPFLWSPRRQALHDRLAGSVVVLERVPPEVVPAAAAESGLPRGGWILIVHVVTTPLFALGIWAAGPAIEGWGARQEVQVALLEGQSLQDVVVERYDEGEGLEAIHEAPDPAAEGADPDKLGKAAEQGLFGGAHFVASIASGVVHLDFTAEASPRLRGQHLALVPAVAEDGRLDWVCGQAAPPEGFEPQPADYRDLTTVPPDLLPTYCRAP